MFYDIVQRLYTDDGNGDGYLSAEGLRRIDREILALREIGGSNRNRPRAGWKYLAAAPAMYFVAASRQEMIAKHESLWARMQAEADRPLWDPLVPEETVDGHFQRMSNFEEIRHIPIVLCLPAYDSFAIALEKT